MTQGDLINKATRNEFREIMTCFTLSEIESMFDVGNLTPNDSHTPLSGGQRRTLVEKYYANLDFKKPSDVRGLVSVFEEVMHRIQRSKQQWPDDERRNETLQGLAARMLRDGYRFENGRFVSERPRTQLLETPSIVGLTEESIEEHLQKARHKIENGDFAGAITNAYTLFEEFLKAILRKTQTSFRENEGDIKTLYSAVADVLNLNPKGENFEGHLKTILQGLRSQIAGLYEVANKASDRHART